MHITLIEDLILRKEQKKTKKKNKQQNGSQGDGLIQGQWIGENTGKCKDSKRRERKDRMKNKEKGKRDKKSTAQRANLSHDPQRPRTPIVVVAVASKVTGVMRLAVHVPVLLLLQVPLVPPLPLLALPRRRRGWRPSRWRLLWG